MTEETKLCEALRARAGVAELSPLPLRLEPGKPSPDGTGLAAIPCHAARVLDAIGRKRCEEVQRASTSALKSTGLARS